MAAVTYTVKGGDTLSAIARKYNTTASYLAKLNNIANPDKIYVGQVIIISGDTASTTSSGGSSGGGGSTPEVLKATITSFGLQAGTDRTIAAKWSWSKNNTKHYAVIWQYRTSDYQWYEGQDTTTTYKESLYTPPAHATAVAFNVKPISETYTGTAGNGQQMEFSYWTAEWTAGARHEYETMTTETLSTMATITQFGLQAGTDRTLFATWTWEKANTASYDTIWQYWGSDGVRFEGGSGSTIGRQSTYNAPANAVGVAFSVQPISEKKDINGVKTSYWTAQRTSEKRYYFDPELPDAPPTPNVSVEDNLLTATINNLDPKASYVDFEVVENDRSTYKTATVPVSTNSASYSCTVLDGNRYKVRCRVKIGNLYSDWSDYSDGSKIQLKPSAPSGITSCVAASETSVRLEWSASMTAKSYEIEYSTEEDHLGASNDSTTISNVEGTTYTVTGLETGKTYYFRVRAKNDAGESGWTSPKHVVIGSKPEAPTTWSSTTTAITGDSIVLYWTHNCEDNSTETKAELEITIDGETKTYTVENTSGEDEIRSYKISTSSFKEGASIKWRVRTAGITQEFGAWSISRTIDIYSPPSLSLTMTDSEGKDIRSLTSYPFYIKGVAGPATQKPLGYHVSIVSNMAYETVDEIGNFKMVAKGQEIYSKFFDIDTDLLLELTPSSVDLENNNSYTIKCVVTMNSGLNAEETVDFEVTWEDKMYPPNAEISFDPNTLCAHIRPYCDMYPIMFYKVTHDQDTDKYYRTGDILTDVSGTSVDNALTEQWEDIVYYGITGEGEHVYFCVTKSTTPELIDNVKLAVYRREYDGRFVEIAKGMDNAKSAFVTDPHPSLDYARYRVVAISESTGAVSYNDIPGYPVGVKAVIIQWDENWNGFDTDSSDRLAIPSWSGSVLKLPYNIDVSDDYSMDVALVEYIGRSHPVSYYGTQLGATSTWSMEIAKSDKNTLYGLRKLAIYTGDVYVREPSGSGYWANVSVSFKQTHCETTIPVTLTIVRVEGGI